MKALTAYDKYTAQNPKNTRSTTLRFPRVTITNTRAAAAITRTVRHSAALVTPRKPPKIGAADATPANSVAVLPRSQSTNIKSTQKVTLTPKLSRIRSASPLPVTAPIRAHISCVTTRAIVTGMSNQSSV